MFIDPLKICRESWLAERKCKRNKHGFWIAVSPEALFAESLEELCRTGHLHMAMQWLREGREVANTTVNHSREALE